MLIDLNDDERLDRGVGACAPTLDGDSATKEWLGNRARGDLDAAVSLPRAPHHSGAVGGDACAPRCPAACGHAPLASGGASACDAAAACG